MSESSAATGAASNTNEPAKRAARGPGSVVSSTLLAVMVVSGAAGISPGLHAWMGSTPTEAMWLSMPVGAAAGFVLALVVLLVPRWRAAEARRDLIECLDDLARVDRRQSFDDLLHHGRHADLSELTPAIHRALLSAHRDRLEAASLRRELDARVTRKTKAVVAELSKISTTDELTGLLNRRGFDQSFAELFDESASSGVELALLAIDMDRFKQLNDTLGHESGDVALRAAGEVMRSQLRQGDIAGRIGGDEFVIALRSVKPAQAGQVAQRLIDLYRVSPHGAAIRAHWPTLSIGIACALELNVQSVDELKRRADQALYVVKKSGRNGVSIADRRPPASSGGARPGKAA